MCGYYQPWKVISTGHISNADGYFRDGGVKE